MQQTNVLEYLEGTASRLPDRPAFVGEGEAMTFEQVRRAARAVGSALARRGLEREPVAVLMPKRPRTVAAFLGCVYAGCHYAPLDEEAPRRRSERILDGLGARVMICDGTTAALAREIGFSGEIAAYEDLAAEPEDGPLLERVRARQLDTDPVYVVFTSGSTGTPKGVTACHRSVIDYIENLSRTLGFGRRTRFANQAPLYFDACLKELYPTLKVGAVTYFVPRQLFMAPVRLVEYLNENRINTICWAASALAMISALGTFRRVRPRYLRTVAFGGEVFPVRQFRLWREALPQADFFNLYGPTEATGMCCWYKTDRDFGPDETIPIGGPFPNTDILLLDEHDRPAAPGETGEICVRGASLALGYYRDFAGTDRAFVQNPLNDRYPERLYRTGDLARRNSRGELVFAGRKDQQIKHMGHRVELGEIEAGAAALETVRAACCLYDEKRGRIVLYYAGDAGPAEVVGGLQQRLPDYMLPNLVLPLERLPRTAGGKADRTALRRMYEQADK